MAFIRLRALDGADPQGSQGQRRGAAVSRCYAAGIAVSHGVSEQGIPAGGSGDMRCYQIGMRPGRCCCIARTSRRRETRSSPAPIPGCVHGACGKCLHARAKSRACRLASPHEAREDQSHEGHTSRRRVRRCLVSANGHLLCVGGLARQLERTRALLGPLGAVSIPLLLQGLGQEDFRNVRPASDGRTAADRRCVGGAGEDDKTYVTWMTPLDQAAGIFP